MGKNRSLLNANRPTTCEGRVIYNKKKLADTAAARSRKRTGHQNIETYKCDLKSHYHIGHQQERGKLADTRTAPLPDRVERPRVPGPVAGGKTKLPRVGQIAGSLWATIGESQGAEEGV